MATSLSATLFQPVELSLELELNVAYRRTGWPSGLVHSAHRWLPVT
jgi:hypothetical protein